MDLRDDLNDYRIRQLVDVITTTAWHHRNAETSQALRNKVAEVAIPLLKHPDAAHGYVRVRRDQLAVLLNLIDPAPTVAEGKTYVFKNPMAAEVLTRLSAEIRALVDSMQENR